MLVTKAPLQVQAGETYASDVSRASLRLILLEAALWSNIRADLAEPIRSLRSPSLAPYLFNESRFETVHDVVTRRHHHLEADGRIQRLGGRVDDVVDSRVIGLDDPPRDGRLLVWERDTTIDDGAGEAETAGYLDESDMPPWDTWVAYVDPHPRAGYLVTWVPALFVERVGRAISVNAYGALYWLRGSKLLLEEVLAEEQLLV